jgi:hypothetical protein
MMPMSRWKVLTSATSATHASYSQQQRNASKLLILWRFYRMSLPEARRDMCGLSIRQAILRNPSPRKDRPHPRVHVF